MKPDTANFSSPQLIKLPEVQPQTASGPAVLANLRALHGVKVELTVVLGQADTTLGELMSLQPAALLKLDRGLDCPVDLMVDGSCVARGKLVAIDDNFGICITEVATSVQ